MRINAYYLQLFDLFDEGLFLIDSQGFMLLSEFQSPDLLIYLIIVADAQMAILTAEVILDLLLLVQLCPKLVFPSLFLCCPLLLPVSAERLGYAMTKLLELLAKLKK